MQNFLKSIHCSFQPRSLPQGPLHLVLGPNWFLYRDGVGPWEGQSPPGRWRCLSFPRGHLGVPVLPKRSNGGARSSKGVKLGACPFKGVSWGCRFFPWGQMGVPVLLMGSWGCLSFPRSTES